MSPKYRIVVLPSKLHSNSISVSSIAMATRVLANQMNICSYVRFQRPLFPHQFLAQGSEESNQINRHRVPQVQIVATLRRADMGGGWKEQIRETTVRELLGGTVTAGTDGLDEWGGREVFRFCLVMKIR